LADLFRLLVTLGARYAGLMERTPFYRRIRMTIASHLQELRRKHESLSSIVEQTQRSPAADQLKIAELKKKKLKLKEEITRLAQ
jgi:hypothetical protein